MNNNRNTVIEVDSLSLNIIHISKFFPISLDDKIHSNSIFTKDLTITFSSISVITFLTMTFIRARNVYTVRICGTTMISSLAFVDI